MASSIVCNIEGYKSSGFNVYKSADYIFEDGGYYTNGIVKEVIPFDKVLYTTGDLGPIVSVLDNGEVISTGYGIRSEPDPVPDDDLLHIVSDKYYTDCKELKYDVTHLLTMKDIVYDEYGIPRGCLNFIYHTDEKENDA